MGFYLAGVKATNISITTVCANNFWNPHSTKKIYLLGMTFCFDQVNAAAPGASAQQIDIVRSTTRGTPTLTLTPDIDNAWQRDIIPPSGVIMDHDYSTNPTLDTSIIWRYTTPITTTSAQMVGTGFDRVWAWPGIAVPAGTGIAPAENNIDYRGNWSWTWWEMTPGTSVKHDKKSWNNYVKRRSNAHLAYL